MKLEPQHRIASFIFIISLIICTTDAFSQTVDKYYGTSLGYDPSYFQLGASKGKTKGFVSTKTAVLYNYSFPDKAHGITASYSYGALFCAGIDVHSRFTTDEPHFILKPKVGFGFPALFSFNYGCNFNITNGAIYGLLSAEINIPLKTIRGSQNGKTFFGLIQM